METHSETYLVRVQFEGQVDGPDLVLGSDMVAALIQAALASTVVRAGESVPFQVRATSLGKTAVREGYTAPDRPIWRP